MSDDLEPRTEREHLIAARAAERERRNCWEEINRYIKTGPLPEPQHSERNGMVLACNIICPN